MQLRYEQLAEHLQKQLAPIYLVSGDVPLLIQEACDSIRLAAQQQGYTEREIFSVENHFNWQQLLDNANCLSLFSSKQILELRIANSTLGDAGTKALKAYTENLPADKILLITMPKLDSKTQQTSWYKNINNHAVTLAIWLIEAMQLPQWLKQRCAKVGLQIEPLGLQMLADSVEGNLLAAAQEIEKLRLLHGTGKITADDIAQAISNNSRFDIFSLTDAALNGDGKRTIKILDNLQHEGIEPTLILWALAREIRSLESQAHLIANGSSIEKILQEQRVWEKRKPIIRRALQRHHTKSLQQLLIKASHIDRIIKGLKSGNVWDALQQLSLELAGIKLCQT